MKGKLKLIIGQSEKEEGRPERRAATGEKARQIGCQDRANRAASTARSVDSGA